MAKQRLPIYDEPRWRISLLQHLSFALTKLYFAISGSKITLSADWQVEPRKHYVIAANHLSWHDPFMVTTALGWKRLHPLLPCRFIAAPKFLKRGWLRSGMKKLGSYPSHEFRDWPFGIDASEGLLQRHNTIVIFPQGRITVERDIEMKRGVSILAEKESTEIVPVLLERAGTRIFMSRFNIQVGTPKNMSGLSANQIMQHVFELRQNMS